MFGQFISALLHFPIMPDHKYESIDHTTPSSTQSSRLQCISVSESMSLLSGGAPLHSGGAANSNPECGWFLCTDLVFAFAYNECRRSVHAECSSTPFCSIPILHNTIEPPKTRDTHGEDRFRLPASCSPISKCKLRSVPRQIKAS